MKAYYILSGLQEILVRKLAKNHSNPNFSVKVRKNNILEGGGLWSKGNRFSVEWEGNNMPSELAFRRELKANNLQECIY
jgi:hypothetical protein